MNRIPGLIEQIQFSQRRTEMLLRRVEEDIWRETTDELGTNIAWQVGHMLIGRSFNGVVAVTGPNDMLKEIAPWRQYVVMYGLGSDPNREFDLKPTPTDFRAQLSALTELIVLTLSRMDESLLVEPPLKQHPFAKTRLEVLQWCPQHDAWHLGQISMMRRIINGNRLA